MENWKRYGIYLLGLLAGILGLWLIYKIAVLYLLPFIIGILIAIILEPMVSYFEKRFNLTRAIGTGISLAILLILFLTVISSFLVKLVTELYRLANYVPDMLTNIKDQITFMIAGGNRFLGKLPSTLADSIKQNAEKLLNQVVEVGKNFFTSIFVGLAQVPEFIIILLIALIAAYFFSKDLPQYQRLVFNVLPENYRQKSEYVLKEAIAAAFRFLKAQAILVGLSTILTIFGLYLIGAAYPLTLGLIIGFLDLVPIVGPSLIIFPWAGILLIQGKYLMAVEILILYMAISAFRKVVEAKVVAENLGLDPLATLISMYVGLKLLGVLGIAAGPIILLIIKALIDAEIINFHKK
ncbi:sporulation integral membrane protein YtvI [Carboxydothermus ferrireducens]|uniref:Sporulation integral membrane protein YtvI n=1 Tax=Carboxydothermus ferrireducens DSM 11255 TaxID=1119529 RepID=A0ABX2RER4_9THEO|nr:sporulation integral membrane protein YtvI [Carboxydothermus ferrireducens]NYE58528.1 sporulation integral membrane protein YtvI [Carboxydothermus ferrireducens DSM 11255]